MSLAFIVGSISSRDRKVLVCSRCLCDLRNILCCWDYSCSSGISVDCTMCREVLSYYPYFFYCSHYILWPFVLLLFLSLLLHHVWMRTALKVEAAKRERKENQLGMAVIVPFSSQNCKSCMWSQPLNRCTHNIVGNSRWRLFGAEGCHMVSGHTVHSGGFSLAFEWVSACICGGVRGQYLGSRALWSH